MTTTYLNPVYPHNFADPFVLQHQGEFWAYCTGIQADQRCFGILHSLDLVDWQSRGSAMDPLPGGHTCYWAPEVSYHNGRFYLYYSVGNEERMQIRVATSTAPAGPFEDSGHRLTHEPFAIDPHIFQDQDSQRYLFYATDFLERDRVGTGTVVDRLLDPFTLAGEPWPVTLPGHDWQIYDPAREEKGGVRWHTIEGSFVLHHKGLYYQMFSGGNWQNPSYGVNYATIDDLSRREEWVQASHGDPVTPLLRSIPGRVIGPGHNSVVRGPDNRQLFCVYHRWSADLTRREIAIDRLEWVGARLDVLGPTDSPQPVPIPPTFRDHFDTAREAGLGPHLACQGGQWRCEAGVAHQTAPVDLATARCRVSASSFRGEVSAWSLKDGAMEGAFGLMLFDAAGEALRAGVQPGAHCLNLQWRGEGSTHTERLRLPDEFRAGAPHLFRVDVDAGRVEIALAEAGVGWSGTIHPASTYQLALFTDATLAAFGHLSLTEGWEERWEGSYGLAERGWHTQATSGAWQIEAQQLRYAPVTGGATLQRGPVLMSYELVINACLESASHDGLAYALLPALGDDGSGLPLTVEPDGERWVMRWPSQSGIQRFPLPLDFAPNEFQHFRIRKVAGRLAIFCGTAFVGEVEIGNHPTRVGVAGYDVPATFDLIRLTALPTPGE